MLKNVSLLQKTTVLETAAAQCQDLMFTPCHTVKRYGLVGTTWENTKNRGTVQESTVYLSKPQKLPSHGIEVHGIGPQKRGS